MGNSFSLSLGCFHIYYLAQFCSVGSPKDVVGGRAALLTNNVHGLYSRRAKMTQIKFPCFRRINTMNGAPDEAGVQKDEVGDFLLLGVITKGRRSMEIESKTTDDTRTGETHARKVE